MRPSFAIAFLVAALQAPAARAQSVAAQVPAGVAPSFVAVNPVTHRVYVANQGSRSVTVLDGATNATVAVPVGADPRYIGINSRTNRIYVANGRDSTISVIDGATHAVTTLATGGAGPIDVNEATNQVFVVRLGPADEVTRIDGATNSWYTMAIDSFTPVALAVNPVTNRLYVANYTTGDVRIVDLDSGSDFPPTKSIGVWSKPSAVAVNTATNRTYVIADDARGPIAIIDGATAAAGFLAPAGHAAGPRALAVNPGTNKIYAAFNNEVIVIDGATNAMTFLPMPTPVALAVNASSNKIYAPSASGTLTVIDGATNATVSVAIPVGATGVAVDPAVNRAYISGPGITVIDGAGVAAPQPPPSQGSAANVQGLWWASPGGSEAGWGLSIAQQGGTVFATWYTYDANGQPTWLVMSSGARTGTNSYSGELYRVTGPAFNSPAFDPARVSRSVAGTATLAFADGNNGTLTASVDGVSVSKPLTRQVYSAPVPVCGAGQAPGALPNYQDVWWRSPAGSESGWGVHIDHQGDILFVTWYTYGADGKATWFVGSRVERTGNGTYSGTLYQAGGPPWNLQPWNPARVGLVPVGTISFAFADAGSATMSYTVGGLAQSKPITRQVFASPTSVCR